MNQNYYPIDFEAQYEETSEKMIEITSKYKDKIRTMKPSTIAELDEQLEALQLQIDDNELQFRKEPIYSQFAPGQLMAQKRKQPPQMCPQCGDELKKQIQCEFCAQIFCNKCCSRKRIIPFVSKDIRLCCEQCHWKFVKLFDNKNFYEQKQKLANVINFVKNKINKISEKVTAKSNQVQEYRKIKRDQKIKEKALQNKIIQQQKKLKQIQEELRKVVAEKAQRMQQQQRRRKLEDQERQKARKAEQQRERIQQQQKRKEEQRIKEAKELEEKLLLLSASQKKIKQEQIQKKKQRQRQRQKEKQKEKEKDLMELLRKKQQQLKKREEQLAKKEQQNRKKADASNDQKSVNSKNSFKNNDTPKQSISKNSEQRQKIFDTIDSKSASRSRKGSEEQTKRLIQRPLQNLVRTQSTKSTTELSSSKKSGDRQQKQQQKIDEEPTDSLQRSLANMFTKQKKDDDTKSVNSNLSKISKSILDMSVNQLLAVRIPVARTNSKIQVQEKQTTPQIEIPIVEQIIISSARKTLQRRQSIKVEEVVEEVKQEEMRLHKDSILRNSSQITASSKATTMQQDVTPQKCSCLIM